MEAVVSKCQEAYLILLVMSHQFDKAVQVALEVGLVDRAAQVANKNHSDKERKLLWRYIAEHRMKNEIVGFPSPEAKQKLREILEFLLTNRNSNLTFADVLPMLPPKTKKRDVMPFLRT